MNNSTAANAPYLDLIAKVFALRKAAAYEASVLKVLTHYETLPKSVRRSVYDQIERLTFAARGHVLDAYADIHSDAAIAETFTTMATGEHADRAVAEFKALSRAIAHEGRIIGGYTKFKTFPKTRATFNTEQAIRMYRVGELGLDCYTKVGQASMNHALRTAGAKRELTAEDFENEPALATS